MLTNNITKLYFWRNLWKWKLSSIYWIFHTYLSIVKKSSTCRVFFYFIAKNKVEAPRVLQSYYLPNNTFGDFTPLWCTDVTKGLCVEPRGTLPHTINRCYFPHTFHTVTEKKYPRVNRRRRERVWDLAARAGTGIGNNGDLETRNARKKNDGKENPKREREKEREEGEQNEAKEEEKMLAAREDQA